MMTLGDSDAGIGPKVTAEQVNAATTATGASKTPVTVDSKMYKFGTPDAIELKMPLGAGSGPTIRTNDNQHGTSMAMCFKTELPF